jgi:transcription initiation protein SPT3
VGKTPQVFPFQTTLRCTLRSNLPAKRFREFLNLPSHLDLRANDDTVDIVGFLAFEMVRSLTIAGLEVKKSLEESYLHEDYTSSPVSGKRKLGMSGDSANKRRREDSPDCEQPSALPACSLFLPPPEARTPLRPEHIQDAFARMQGDWSQRRTAGMRNWRGGLVRTGVSLI